MSGAAAAAAAACRAGRTGSKPMQAIVAPPLAADRAVPNMRRQYSAALCAGAGQVALRCGASGHPRPQHAAWVNPGVELPGPSRCPACCRWHGPAWRPAPRSRLQECRLPAVCAPHKASHWAAMDPKLPNLGAVRADHGLLAPRRGAAGLSDAALVAGCATPGRLGVARLGVAQARIDLSGLQQLGGCSAGRQRRATTGSARPAGTRLPVGRITAAGRGFQAGAVAHRDFAATVPDQALSLQSACRGGHADPAHPEQGNQQFVRDVKAGRFGMVLVHQQPARQPGADHVETLAGHRPGELAQSLLDESMRVLPECGTACQFGGQHRRADAPGQARPEPRTSAGSGLSVLPSASCAPSMPSRPIMPISRPGW